MSEATFAVEGDEVVGGGLRLSLVAPFAAVERFMALTSDEVQRSWLEEVREIRALMPESARAQLDECPDGALVVKAVREWHRAFDARLGKHLLWSDAGGSSGQS